MYKSSDKQIYKEDKEKYEGVFWCSYTCLFMKKNGDTYSSYDTCGDTWIASSYRFNFIEYSGWYEALRCLDEKLVEDFILSTQGLNAKDLFWLGLQMGKTFEEVEESRIISFNHYLLADFLKNNNKC